MTSGTLYTPTAVGTPFSVSATYNGNAFNGAVTATCEPGTVAPYADAIGAVATSTATAGQSISDTVTISGLSTSPAPTGNVILTLYIGTGCTGTIQNTWTNMLTSTTGWQVIHGPVQQRCCRLVLVAGLLRRGHEQCFVALSRADGATGTTVSSPAPPPPPPGHALTSQPVPYLPGLVVGRTPPRSRQPAAPGPTTGR